MAPRRVPLLDHLGRGIEDLQEGDRARGRTSGRLHHILSRPQTGKTETCSPSGLMDQSRVLHRLEDPLHRILEGEDEARRELLQLTPCVHQRGGIRQELEVRHKAIELAGQLLYVGRGLIELICLGHVPGHPPEHLFRRLYDLTLVVLGQVAFLKNVPGSLGQFEFFFHVPHLLGQMEKTPENVALNPPWRMKGLRLKQHQILPPPGVKLRSLRRIDFARNPRRFIEGNLPVHREALISPAGHSEFTRSSPACQCKSQKHHPGRRPEPASKHRQLNGFPTGVGVRRIRPPFWTLDKGPFLKYIWAVSFLRT